MTACCAWPRRSPTAASPTAVRVRCGVGSGFAPRFCCWTSCGHAAGCKLGEDCPPSLLYQNIGKHPSAAPREQGHAHEGHPADDFNGHVPNTVTSLLAAYRSFDTMFETAVIFVAGVSLLLLLRRRREGEDGVPISDASQRRELEANSDPRSEA